MFRIVALCPTSVCRHVIGYQVKLLNGFQVSIMDERRKTRCSRLFPLLGIPLCTHTIRHVVRWTLMSTGIRQELPESAMSDRKWSAFERTSPFQGQQHSPHYSFLTYNLLENGTSDAKCADVPRKDRNTLLFLNFEISWLFKAWPKALSILYPRFYFLTCRCRPHGI